MAISGVDPIANGSGAMPATIDRYGRGHGDGLFDLTGMRAVVTGGGRGLGRGMAEALASAGATVAIVGRSEATRSRRASSAVSPYAPISPTASAALAFERAVELLGGLDVLVAAHGTTLRGPALELDVPTGRPCSRRT